MDEYIYMKHEAKWWWTYDPILMIQVMCCTIGFLHFTMEKTLIFEFFNKGLLLTLVFAFWWIFTIKNNVEWKPCSHVEASLQKVNVIVQVLVQKGPYNVRMTTTMKFVSLSSSKSWCYLYDSFVHSQKKKYNLEIKVDVIKSFPKKNIKHKTPRFINLI
jgi:hypothetical protein